MRGPWTILHASEAPQESVLLSVSRVNGEPSLGDGGVPRAERCPALAERPSPASL